MRPTRRTPRSRPGFALLAALWLLLVVGALATAATLIGQRCVALAQYRRDFARARWAAEDCAARFAAVLDDALASPIERTNPWVDVDRLSLWTSSHASAPCECRAQPAGYALDVNSASVEQLRRLFSYVGIAPGSADSLVDALLDWRDPDTVPRELGVEANWGSPGAAPRNGDFADSRELLLVRGFPRELVERQLLGTEPGRVALAHAPPPVLASLPGFGRSEVATLARARERDRSKALTAVNTTHGSLLDHSGEISRLATVIPDAWILTSTGWAGTPPVRYVLERRLVRAGGRAAVTRQRTWQE